MGSQALPANLLQHGLLSSQRHLSCQDPAPAWASHGVTASFEHPPAPVWGSPQAAGPLWTSMGCRDTVCLTMVCSTGISAPVPGAPPAPSSALTLGSCRAVALTYSHSSLSSAAGFFSFLNTLSQKCYHHRWWARPWPAAGASWSQLALALSDTGEASGSFSQKPPL